MQVTSVALSPDGARLLTGCDDKTGRVCGTWPTRQRTAVRRQHAGRAGGRLQRRREASVAAGGADKSITVWNAADGKEVKKFAEPVRRGQQRRLQPRRQVRRRRPRRQQRPPASISRWARKSRASPATPAPSRASPSRPKGDQVISASADKTVQVWNVADGTSKQKMDHGAAVLSLALSKDGTQRGSGGADKTVKVWTLADGKTVGHDHDAGRGARASRFSPDGTRLAVGGADNRARVYGARRQAARVLRRTTARCWRWRSTPTASASSRPAPTRRPASGRRRCVWQARHAGPVRQAVVQPQGRPRRLGRRRQDREGVERRRRQARSSPSPPTTGRASASPSARDGTKVVSCGADKTVKVWTVAGQPAPVPDETSPSSSRCRPRPVPWPSVPNGLRVAAAVGRREGNVIRCTSSTRPTARRCSGLRRARRGGPLAGLSSPTTARWCPAAADKTAKLSDVGVRPVLEAHAGGVSGVAFHSNGTQALTGGADKTVEAVGPGDGQGGEDVRPARRSGRRPSPSAATSPRSAPRPARSSRCGTSPTARKSRR